MSIDIFHSTSPFPFYLYPSLLTTITFQYEGDGVEVIQKNKRDKIKMCGVTGLITQPLKYQILQPLKSVIVRLYPWAIPKFFKEAANALSNQCIGLEDIVSNQKICLLMEKIQHNPSPLAIMSHVQDFFIELCLNNDNTESQRLIKVAYEIAQNPCGTIQEIGKKYSFSKRSLERHFLEIIGLSPKKFMLSARFQQTLKGLRKGTCWSSIANDFSYDQSHFIKGFQAFTGLTPQQFQLTNFPVKNPTECISFYQQEKHASEYTINLMMSR
ncbi:helix-turn-helix domain-containing protein [Legionella cardiaca]|uniref:Helix-turn-helix domain-containing protein n=1 Tax=Legionella cardiaca TaxID=1071983 RepID=A0ABY8AN20_9GAMM|nr:helix-turn-helix domain-containing protein [Legionella cardiaca]WED41963.1 helix-turn-helix domain-containing protein [Legionella cardiaca]